MKIFEVESLLIGASGSLRSLLLEASLIEKQPAR